MVASRSWICSCRRLGRGDVQGARREERRCRLGLQSIQAGQIAVVLLVVILELRLNLALVICGSKVPGAGKEPDCLQVILVCLVFCGLGSCGQRCIGGSGLGLGVGIACCLGVNELQFDVGKRKLQGIAESQSALVLSGGYIISSLRYSSTAAAGSFLDTR